MVVNTENHTPLSIVVTLVIEAPHESYDAWTDVVETLVQAGAHLRTDDAVDASLPGRVREGGLVAIYDLITVPSQER